MAASAATWLAGGRPVWLAPDRPPLELELMGVVVTGGGDINPRLYGSAAAPWTPPDVLRDEFELAVLSYAELRALPVLGICRGAQLINVHAGGNLHTDVTHLRSAAGNRRTALPVKWAEVGPGTRLERVCGRARLRINNLHHQAVRDPGRGLNCSARDADGIIQAIETGAERWVLGVQWHPEYLAWKRAHMRLFRALVSAARAAAPATRA